MIRIGTSGFSYKDWIGPFYPEGTASTAMLPYYAQHFDTVELDYTYYAMPAARTLESLAKKVPEGFLFSLKAHQSLTHDREDLAKGAPQYIEALKPLQERDMLAAILLQFPTSFHNTPENQDYLAAMRAAMPGQPLVAGFRHRDWITQRVMARLKELQIAYCCVDQPRLSTLVPPVAVVTADLAYVRLHGRNAAKWFQHQEAWQRYDYSYTAEELEPWKEKIQTMEKQAPTVLIYANNHWKGQAINTANQLKLMLYPEAPGSQES
ncbi:MAG: DUF72 domain-containing protein [Anaerolineae bacterium]